MNIPAPEPHGPATAEQCAALIGVRKCPPDGTVAVENGWLRIGVLVHDDNGRVLIVPRRGLGERATTILRCAGEQIAIFGRCTFDGWRHCDGLGWVVAVITRDQDAIAEHQAAAQRKEV